MVIDSNNGHRVHSRVSPSGPNDPPRPTFIVFKDVMTGPIEWREKKENPHPIASSSNLHSSPDT